MNHLSGMKVLYVKFGPSAREQISSVVRRKKREERKREREGK